MHDYPMRLQILRAGAAGLLLSLACAAAAADEEPPPFSPPGSFVDPGHFAHRDGATLFRAVCQGCHMPDARGAQGAGMYPALAGDVRLASAEFPVTTLLTGRRNMPSFAHFLDDAQIAEVVNFVRSHFGNAYADAVSATDVAALRARLAAAAAP